MKTFHIEQPDQQMRPLLEAKINDLTKPKGALGRLEELALQVGLIQQTLRPTLHHPCNILFGGDHGIADEGVSVSPKEVTWQQMIHFAGRRRAGINFFCRQHGFTLKVVDAGVDYDFEPHSGIIDKKVRKGTREGCNIVSFGEMGIGNTSASSLWMHAFTHIPLDRCIGAGSGLDDKGVRRKYHILKAAWGNYDGDGSPLDIIRYFGGYEMAMAVGGMLRAAELHMIILVDGFIMTNCLLAASRLYPEVTDYAIFGHRGDENGHALVLEYLQARPLLDLGMRLGEGTGAVCAYPLIDSAVRMLNEMDTFGRASITKYF